MFAVTILGNNSALPAHGRHPTAQVVVIEDQLLLLDCGEGTQLQMSKYKIKRSKINYIFISHLHGDHFFGLIGLITSFSLQSRQNDLHIYAPPELAKIIQEQLQVSGTQLPYKLLFHDLREEGKILEEEKFSVECFLMDHRITCFGFLISEKKKPRKLDMEKLSQVKIPATFYSHLSMGEDYTSPNGIAIKNESVTTENIAPKKYAFCADTRFYPTIVPIIHGADLMYHEATYLNNLLDKAFERYHSTSIQAAQMAVHANAKKLLVGHFSSKYESLDDFLTEARSVFPETALAEEGVTFIV